MGGWLRSPASSGAKPAWRLGVWSTESRGLAMDWCTGREETSRTTLTFLAGCRGHDSVLPGKEKSCVVEDLGC